MNNYTFTGNLTKDPVSRTVNGRTGQISVCNFSVAVNDRLGDKDYVTYVNVSAWGKTGEVCQKYLAKGRKVRVSGRSSVNAYTSSTGECKASLEVRAGEVEFLSSRPVNDGVEPAPNYEAAAPVVVEVDEDQLPF